jgi:replication-associated recombination protein RarA
MTNSLLFPEMAPAPGFDFPEPLSDKYRPRRIADFAGLAEPKKILTGFVSNPRNCGFLFVGPAGTGKTSMGIALASELKGFMHHIKARKCTVEAVEDVVRSCHYYPPLGFNRHIILIDEADLMSIAAQETILSYLDGTDTIPVCTWVFTCNATDRFHERFLSRNRVLNFSTYAIQAEAAELLESVWTREASPEIPKPNFARLIKDATGNIRAALASLETRLDAARA